MRTRSLFASVAALTLVLGSCSMTPHKTGFLSDYKNLKADGDTLRYENATGVKTYDRFIVEPVRMVSHKDAEPVDAKYAEAVTGAFTADIISKLRAASYEIVDKPGPGVARVRVAITDIDKSMPVLNIIPQTHLLGFGIGGASMEAELVDSASGKQIAAVVKGAKGSRLSFAGMTSRTGDAQAVCEDWADEFVKRVKKAHGR